MTWPEVISKLAEVGLDDYAPKLKEEGYDSMDAFDASDKAAIEQIADEIGLKPGHKAKFVKLFCVAAPVAVAAESVQPVIATSTAIPAEKASKMASPNDVVLMTNQATGNAKIGNSYGDRQSEQKGMSALNSNNIEVGNWEVKPIGTCQKMFLALKCASADQTRSYIYIRSNSSLELNDTNGIKAFGTMCSDIQDNISVEYYDRAPHKEGCKLAPFPCCCMYYTDVPKVEVLDNGYMCCFVKIDPCGLGKQAVVMPFEHVPPPFCCYSNRTSRCDNCGEMCGPPTGNPKIHFPFSPQPKDAVAFVAAIQEAMTTARSLAKQGAPDTAEMER